MLQIFDMFFDVEYFEELKMDTDCLYLALAHEKFYNCIRPAKTEEWKALPKKDSDVSFRTGAS